MAVVCFDALTTLPLKVLMVKAGNVAIGITCRVEGKESIKRNTQ